jgi:phosphatidate cytidylyltransferase
MLPRVVTGLVGLPIVLFLTYVGAPLFNLGTNVAGVIGGLELGNMIRQGHYRLTALIVITILTVTTAIWTNLLPLALLVLGVFVLIGVLENRQQRGVSLRHYGYAMGGALYIGVSMGVLALIRSGENGLLLTLMMFINNWCTDSFAMIGGRLFGKHKLAPTISPSKTIEGAAFGLTMGFIGGFMLALLGGLPWQTALVANICVALATETGDLIESLLKRQLHVKDSGSILPGHGGFLDRMDGTLLAAPTLYLVLVLLGI